MRTIYCYHKEEENNDRIKLGKLPKFKIGDTTIDAADAEEAAAIRIKQQDTTSCSEPLIMDWCVSVPDTFLPGVEHVDKVFHDWLKDTKQISP